MQATYSYLKVQPPVVVVNQPAPPPFYRLVYANDPMFGGPLQQVRYRYVDYGTYSVGDVNMTAVLAEYAATGATDIGTLVNYFEMQSWTQQPSGLPAPYWTRVQTRGDGAARTLSWFNPTKAFTYFYNGQQYHGVGQGQMLVDPFTDFFNNTNIIETDQYDWTHYFQTPTSITDTNNHTTTQTLETTLGKITQEAHPDTSHQNWTYTSTTTPYYARDSRGQI